MALGTLTIVDDQAGVGPLKVTRVTVVGDGAYPAGGSIGFRQALIAATKERREILSVQPNGPNGDSHLEYTPQGTAAVVTVVASTDLFSSGSVLHGLSSGDAVRFRKQRTHDADHPDPVLPGGVVEDTVYYVIASGLTTTAFKVSATSGGSTIDVTSAGAGDFSVRKEDKLLVRVMSTGVESAVADQSAITYSALVTSY